jgi:hypothetical protein
MPKFNRRAQRAHLMIIAWMWLVTISILGAPVLGLALYKGLSASSVFAATGVARASR